jgi:host cell surface-exposed lipoprotein
MSVESPVRPDLGAPEPKKSMSFAKKGIIAVVGLIILGTAVGSALQPSPEAAAPSPSPIIEESAAPEPSEAPEPSAAPEPTTAPEIVEPEFTVSQENAIETAKDYLDYTAFSESGLIDQLKFEDYSKADARFAVNHISVNWNEQAAKSAKDYLDYSSFSRQGLIDQLEFEGFTTEQATHGVNTTGL